MVGCQILHQRSESQSRPAVKQSRTWNEKSYITTNKWGEIEPNLDEIISYQPSPNQEAVGEKEQKNNDNDAKKDKENNENELEKTTNENRKGITFGEFAREIVTRNQPVQDITASS